MNQTESPEIARGYAGWRIVWAAFLLATLGWGLGFYSPPIFLHLVVERTGWPLPLVSAAVTFHFLAGIVVVAKLSTLHDRLGIPSVTVAGASSLSLGLIGWANCTQSWQLFAAAALTGVGWVTMAAAAINAIISRWFDAKRPAALSLAYNGASVGGIIMAPLWIILIKPLGFPLAATAVGITSVGIVIILSWIYFSQTPPDALSAVHTQHSRNNGQVENARSLWTDRTFITLAAGMALGLFAQIGLLAHLFSIVAPIVTTELASYIMAAATISAIIGRSSFGWFMPANTDRRLVACLSYAIQITGSLTLAAGNMTDNTSLLVVGVLLVGFGIGNATSIPPLIAQTEFAADHAKKVVPMIVATGQATYAFAPAIFGAVRSMPATSAMGITIIFVVAAIIQAIAIACLLAGRRRTHPDPI